MSHHESCLRQQQIDRCIVNIASAISRRIDIHPPTIRNGEVQIDHLKTFI